MSKKNKIWVFHAEYAAWERKQPIIASTDATRIGHFHTGAHRIITEKLSELYIYPEEATATARKGLNLPINHMNEIVGVIGITGDYDEVMGYGQVVKKMTEILLRESTEQDEKRLYARIRSRFLEDWILSSRPMPQQVLIERASLLDIDTSLPRRIMVSSAQQLDRYIDTAKGQQLIENVEKTIAGIVEIESDNIILRNNARQIMIVRAETDEQLERLAHRLAETVKKKYDVCLNIGIDGNAPDIHKAYVQANKAWRAAQAKQTEVLPYKSITLELFLGDISKQTKTEYLHKVFAGCGYEEISSWISVIEAYFQAEGSINEAAAKLYIHKNTMQYKLKRLEALTGYDIRLPSNAAVFYMAYQFYRDAGGNLIS